MDFIRKSVRVVKMSVGAAKLACLKVHLFYEFLGGSGGKFRNCQCHFIGGLKHDSH